MKERFHFEIPSVQKKNYMNMLIVDYLTLFNDLAQHKNTADND